MMKKKLISVLIYQIVLGFTRFKKFLNNPFGIVTRYRSYKLGEIHIGMFIGSIRNSSNNCERNSKLITHLCHGGAFHFYAGNVGQSLFNNISVSIRGYKSVATG